MNELETIIRRLIREEIRAALEELFPRLQRQNGTTPPKPDGMLLSTREAAKRLAISERTLFMLTQTGQLPCVRAGTAKRYSVETLRKWIQDSEAGLIPRSSDKQPRTSVPHSPTRKPLRSRTTSLGKDARSMQQKSRPSTPAKGPVNRKAIVRQTTAIQDQRQSPNPFSLLLEEIGVDRADLPPLTNGDLRRIAEVDIPTMHGWQYLQRPMAEEAIEKLREHFRKYKRQEQCGDGQVVPQQ